MTTCTAAYEFGWPTFFIPCQRRTGHRGKHRYQDDGFMAEWTDETTGAERR